MWFRNGDFWFGWIKVSHPLFLSLGSRRGWWKGSDSRAYSTKKRGGEEDVAAGKDYDNAQKCFRIRARWIISISKRRQKKRVKAEETVGSRAGELWGECGVRGTILPDWTRGCLEKGWGLPAAGLRAVSRRWSTLHYSGFIQMRLPWFDVLNLQRKGIFKTEKPAMESSQWVNTKWVLPS